MVLVLASFALLGRAHAHNDYAHARPLLDALECGFLRVKADVFLVDGEWRVGHARKEFKPGKTLEALYLDPLLARVKRNRGTVYGQLGVLTLLIDIKVDGEAVHSALRRRLTRYRRMLSDRTRTTVHARAVQIIFSGARTDDCAAGDGFLFKDGTPRDLGDEPFRTPQISTSYFETFGTFASPLPPLKRTEVDDLLAEIHAGGKRLRLWDAPDTPTAWRELFDAGVDLINTDHLTELRSFLLGA